MNVKESKKHNLLSQEEKLDKFLRQSKFEKNKKRKNFIKKFYKSREYDKPPKEYLLDKEIGLEHDVEKFIRFGEKIIDANSTETVLSFENTTRIWPSAVIMLVSLVVWIKSTSTNGSVSGKSSKSEKVNDYLSHCGFYKYVGVIHNNLNSYYPSSEVVQIRKEDSNANTRERQKEVIDLIREYSTLSLSEIEGLDCVVLTEILANVTEHGVNVDVSGWFVLVQYHKRTGIISVCIADNGIGIKNSLCTGNQVDEVEKIVNSNDDVDYIEAAITKRISGAIDSPEVNSTKILGEESLPQGKKRGIGLTRIFDKCKDLGLKLTICSHQGCLTLNEKGAISFKKNLPNKCFAGTLYHIVLPVKRR